MRTNQRRTAAVLAAGTLVALVGGTGCLKFTPVSEIAPPSGPSAEELAPGLVVRAGSSNLGEIWPAAGDPAVLASCAVTLREDDSTSGLRSIVGAVQVSRTDHLEQITDTFCEAFTRELYARVPLDWMAAEEVRRDIVPRSSTEDRLSRVYDGYGYFGGLERHIPILARNPRALATELDRTVFLAGITVRLAKGSLLDSPELRIHPEDLSLAAYHRNGRMRNGSELWLHARDRYLVDDHGSEGIRVLARALAIRLAYAIENGTTGWEDGD